MTDKKTNKEIKQTIEEFFAKIDPEEEVRNIEIKENVVAFEVRSKTPEIFIGKQGRLLLTIQHLLGKILRKKFGKNIFVDLDINQYKKKKIDYLKELAQTTADEVVLSKKEKTLPPMLPYERRIIHLTLSERKDVTTESVGEEPERRVIVKPVL